MLLEYSNGTNYTTHCKQDTRRRALIMITCVWGEKEVGGPCDWFIWPVWCPFVWSVWGPYRIQFVVRTCVVHVCGPCHHVWSIVHVGGPQMWYMWVVHMWVYVQLYVVCGICVGSVNSVCVVHVCGSCL